MPHTVGIGIIGMGWIGTVHSRCYRQVSDRYRDLGIQARMVICADEVKNRAQEAQNRVRELKIEPDEFKSMSVYRVLALG